MRAWLTVMRLNFYDSALRDATTRNRSETWMRSRQVSAGESLAGCFFVSFMGGLVRDGAGH